MISGTYSVSMQLPRQLPNRYETGTLTLTESNGLLSGTLKAGEIISNFKDGRAYGDSFEFSGEIRMMFFKIQYKAKGEISGNRLTATADTKHGVFTITGTRI